MSNHINAAQAGTQADEETLAGALARIKLLEAANAALERRIGTGFAALAAVFDYAGHHTEAAQARAASRPEEARHAGLRVVRAAG